MNRLRKNESGQTLVEFALIASLLFLVLFGIIEFGRIFHAYLVVTSAAREGARKAAVSNVIGDIDAAIRNAAASLADNVDRATDLADFESRNPPANSVLYCIDYPDGAGRQFGDPVEIHIKGHVDLIVPIISDIIGDPYIPRARAVMRVEK